MKLLSFYNTPKCTQMSKTHLSYLYSLFTFLFVKIWILNDLNPFKFNEINILILKKNPKKLVLGLGMFNNDFPNFHKFFKLKFEFIKINFRWNGRTVNADVDPLADSRRNSVGCDAQVNAHVQPTDLGQFQCRSLHFQRCVAELLQKIKVQLNGFLWRVTT